MRVCIDTVIFIDILKNEYPKTQEKFYHALESGEKLITSVITVAELLPQFNGNKKELLVFLNDHRVKVMNIDLESALTASERWMKYLKKKKVKQCPSCKATIPGRDKMLADFLIGGFALTHSDMLLTRDRGVYKTYLKDLKNV